MPHHKNCYHPLFTMLYLQKLLPKDVIKQIPRSTRHAWNTHNFTATFGYEHCALYLNYFNNMSYAHRYAYLRQTFTIMVHLQKTILSIVQHSLTYKKLLRNQAKNVVLSITTLVKNGLSVKRACRLFGIKKNWYNYHKNKNKCPQSILRICFKKHPLQLTQAEQNSIKNWIINPLNQGKNLTHLYYEALNSNIVHCSKNAFNRYAHLFGYAKVFRIPKAKKKPGFRATGIFEYLHLDTTYLPTMVSGVQKIILVKDNYSRAPLHYLRISSTLTSAMVKQVLEETFDKYQLFERTHNIQIITDGGSENQGEVNQWVGELVAPPCVKKITAKTSFFPFSNAMVEGSFHLFKHDFLKGKNPYDDKACDKFLEAFMNHSGNRYFGELYGLTPNQVLAGEIPNKHLFKPQIEQAKLNRIEQNKTYNGCSLPFC